MTDPTVPLEPTLDELTFDLAPVELRQRAEARLARTAEALIGLERTADPPSIESFLRPLDRLLTEVRDLSAHGSFLFAVHPEETTRAAGREVSEAADRFFNSFRLNSAIYRSLERLDLTSADEPTRFAVSKMLREMRRAGVEQDADRRKRLLELTNEIDRVSNQYMENIANGRRSIEVDGAATLAGLPEDYVRAHPADARGKVRITTDYPDFRPVMAYAEAAPMRKALLAEFANKAYPENAPGTRPPPRAPT